MMKSIIVYYTYGGIMPKPIDQDVPIIYKAKISSWNLDVPYQNNYARAIVEFVEHGNMFVQSTPAERARLLRKHQLFWTGRKIQIRTRGEVKLGTVESLIPLTREEIQKEAELRQQTGKLPVPIFKLYVKVGNETRTYFPSDLQRQAKPHPNAEQSK